MSTTVDMTKGSITRHIILFALPLIAANIGQQLYMVVDASIVGLGLGVKALASVGATDWCNWMYLWAIIGFTQAFATFISRHFGSGDYKKMNKTIGASVVLCLFVCLIITAIAIISARPLLIFIKTPADIIDGSVIYLSTMSAGLLIVGMYNMASAVLRALGDGKTPLIAMIIAGGANIALDLLFVLVFKMGIFGAAIASVISQGASFIYCLYKIKKITIIRHKREELSPEKGMKKEMLLFGTPMALQYIVISLGGIILQSMVNMQGSIFVAGYTATTKLYGLMEASSIALGLACATFFAQNFGAKNIERIKKGVLISSFICVILAGIIGGFIITFRKTLLKLFLDVSKEGGAEALSIGLRFLIIMASTLLILYLIHIFRNVLQSMGISLWSMLSGFAECVIRVVMAVVVIKFMGTDALFVAEPIAWLGALLTVLIPYFYYVKKHLK